MIKTIYPQINDENMLVRTFGRFPLDKQTLSNYFNQNCSLAMYLVVRDILKLGWGGGLLVQEYNFKNCSEDKAQEELISVFPKPDETVSSVGTETGTLSC